MIKIKDLKWDSKGLVPVVVQDARTGEVLTLAYMNAESLAKTCELGETVFFSRSRGSLWHKGETSGNYQKVVGLKADCDMDALVVQVVPQGPACHTGARSCFFEPVEGFEPMDDLASIGRTLGELEQVIADRKAHRPEGSYTARLLDKGLKRIMQKVGEEAVETVVAGIGGDREETVRETADLLYHLLVGLSALDIQLRDVAVELQKRRK